MPAGRRGKCERGYVAKQDVDATFGQEPGLDRRARIELSPKRFPAPARLVDVELQPVVLRHADIQRPAG